MIFVFEFMNDEFDYAIFNALHNPDLNEFNEMFSDALSMSEEYCGECQRVCVTVFENKKKRHMKNYSLMLIKPLNGLLKGVLRND